MLIPVSELPATRLELRWRYVTDDPDGWNMFCDYDLVLELGELDIRGEVYDDDHNLIERKRERRLSLGGTRTDRRRPPIDMERGEIDTPFRDHSHIIWDGERLGLPRYVVFEDKAMLIEPRETPPAEPPEVTVIHVSLTGGQS